MHEPHLNCRMDLDDLNLEIANLFQSTVVENFGGLAALEANFEQPALVELFGTDHRWGFIGDVELGMAKIKLLDDSQVGPIWKMFGCFIIILISLVLSIAKDANKDKNDNQSNASQYFIIVLVFNIEETMLQSCS